MASDEMSLSENDIQLPRESSSFFGIKQGNMNSQKETVLILNHLGLVGRGDQLLKGEGVNIEVLLEIGDIILTNIQKI